MLDTDFPESLFDERLRCEPFGFDDDDDIDGGDEPVVVAFGILNPDWVGSNPASPPDDGIPF